jgi:hypothetical protein
MSQEAVVGFARVVLSSRERPFLLEPTGRGLRGVTLRFAHEVRNELEYFSEIPEMKLPPEMMKLAQHIIRTKSADFDSAMLEDHYRSASCASCAENRRNVPRRRLQSSRHARTSSTSWTLSGEASPPTARQSLPPERRGETGHRKARRAPPQSRLTQDSFSGARSLSPPLNSGVVDSLCLFCLFKTSRNLP